MGFLLFKQCLRSKMHIVSLILIMVMGLLGILVGKQYLLKEGKVISEVVLHQGEHIDRNVAYHQDDIGLILYYVRFALIDKSNGLKALSIGQSDVNSNIQRVTIRNLEGQKYDTDLQNPLHLQLGNLDLGFILINLFPLLIIAFTYNLLSSEMESGTWKLVSIQSSSKLKVLLNKLAVRLILVFSSMLMLFFIAWLILPLALDRSFLVFIALGVLYLFFWFSLCFWVISYKRSSSFNAITLLSIWLILVILLPASVNNLLSIKYPVPEAMATMIKQRDGYHTKWDTDKHSTMKKFFDHYPQYAHHEIEEDGFSWLWYYAMQQMGDDESVKERKAMRAKVLQREKVSRQISWLIPTLHTQLTYNDLAGSGLMSHLQFLDRTDEFHERMRLHFYPRIFEDQAVHEVDWSAYKPEFISSGVNTSWGPALLPVLLITAIFIFLSWFNWKRF